MTAPVQNTSIRSALCEVGYGFQSILRIGGLFFANPSPDGRGCREAAGEGYSNEDSWKNFEEMSVVPLTRPAGAGHPHPLGEGFARSIPHFGHQWYMTAPTATGICPNPFPNLDSK
jgi:hypothetical protein